MKNNVWPKAYFQNPNIDKPLEDIWIDIDGYTFEEQYEAENMHDKIDFVIPFPPLGYKGKIIKGIFFSQGVDVIIEKFPRLKEIFFPIANSMFSSYPNSVHADCFFTCYKNKRRENYYKNKYPDKKDIIMIPLQDADFLNENKMAPSFNTPKTIDIFCVSTAFPVKNIPIIARMLKIYEEKYKTVLKVQYTIGNRDLKFNPDGSMDYSACRREIREQLGEVEKILGDIKKYIQFFSYIEYKDLPKYYTSAKCCVLASLLEGKNRFISEAMACDTPIVVFRDFNKYSRGDYPVFFGNSGEYCPEFTPEALADTIHYVINHQNEYEPRKNYLKYSGRINFINTCIDLIPYYENNLPEYETGAIEKNIWVNLAMQRNYQLSFYDFLYGRNIAIAHVRGMEKISSLIKFFYSRFNIK